MQVPPTGTWVYTSGQSTATYTTVGGEFGAVPGLCDAQVMVYASGVLDYSYRFTQFAYFEPPMILPPA